MMGTKKAAGLTAARTTEQQTASYPNHASKSIAKLQIGELLFALQVPFNRKQRENGWQLFGVMLRQYVDLAYGRVG